MRLAHLDRETPMTMTALARHLGIERYVFVQPSAYGRDNTCMLDAMQQVGDEKCRGVVDIDDSLGDQPRPNSKSPSWTASMAAMMRTRSCITTRPANRNTPV